MKTDSGYELSQGRQMGCRAVSGILDHAGEPGGRLIIQ
jgi:hypothetical protein